MDDIGECFACTAAIAFVIIIIFSLGNIVGRDQQYTLVRKEKEKMNNEYNG